MSVTVSTIVRMPVIEGAVSVTVSTIVRMPAIEGVSLCLCL